MYGKDIIIMSREEVRRLQLVKKVVEKELKQVAVAEALGLSSRQIRRLVSRVREEGEKGVVHRLRGRESNRRYSEDFKERVTGIYERKYVGFGPLLASEKLKELNGIAVSDETLRKWLIEKGHWQKRRAGRKHLHWRERKGYYGQMVQMDGSHHDWLEGRGPELVMMGYIDDATGEVYGRFYEYEGTIPALDSFKRYVRHNGIPQSVYLDRHSTYKGWAKPTIEQELKGERNLSQFERALGELGVDVIHANSPQAKGRVERLFRTLQDRVVKEMRLEGIRNISEANSFLETYLPIFNKRFNVVAREAGDLHGKVVQGMSLERILCVKEERVVRNDFTVSYNSKLYQIFTATNAKKISIEERLDGAIHFYYKSQKLKYKEILCRPTQRQKAVSYTRSGKQWKPPKEHPWRHMSFGNAANISTLTASKTLISKSIRT